MGKGEKGMGGDVTDSETELLKAQVRQLENRIDLIQAMLEMMAERRGKGSGAHREVGWPYFNPWKRDQTASG